MTSSVVASAVYQQGRRVQDVALNQAGQWSQRAGHFVWIDLHSPTASVLGELQEQFNLHELAMADAIVRHTRSKLETFGDALFIVAYAPQRKNGQLQFVESQLFAGKGYVLCARYGKASGVDETVRQRCEARPRQLEQGEDFVLHALLTSIIDNYRPLLEQLQDELEELEQEALKKPLTQAQVEQIHGLRHDLLRLKRYTAPLVEICQELQQLDFPFIDKHMRPYFRDLAIHVQRLLQDITGLREMADYAMELGLLMESARQSVVQRKFAAWAAILAFPTAVAGIYGMNFHNMPELSWHYGYYTVIGLIVTCCGGLYANFKRLGWL